MTEEMASRQPAGSPLSVRASSSPLDVVIVNFNGGYSLDICLGSLLREAPEDTRVVVIDNASADGSVEGLEQRFPNIELVLNTANLGFARATNQGLGRGSSEFALLLNPDTRLQPDAIRVALAYIEASPDVAVVGARVILPSGRLDPAARRSFKTPGTYLYKFLGLTALFPRSRTYGRYYLTFLDEDRITDVDSVVGAFMLLRRRALMEVGLLDERYFMYCEDEDLCFRLKRKGWRVVYHPEVRVDHQKGSSSRQLKLRTAYHWHRSLLIFHRHNIAPGHSPFVNGAVYAGIVTGFVVRIVTIAIQMVASSPRDGLRRWIGRRV